MSKPALSAVAILFLVILVAPVPAQNAPPPPATQPGQPSRVVAVTVYQGTALVTREVDVPDAKGLTELVVTSLPPETIDGSLYTEGGDGLHVLNTRFRTQAVQEDTRQEVRAREEQIKTLQKQNEDIQRQIEVIADNLNLLGKLEGFTAATMQQLTEKGSLNAESTLKLATFVMDSRAEKAKAQVGLQQQLKANADAIAFAQRQLSELAAGSSRTEREAVIVVDKTVAGPAQVRLNYLVGASTWRPQYKLRAGGDKDPVQVEYLAAIEQQSGEDWTGVDLVLSTAQPTLSAAPPDLFALDIAVGALAPGGAKGGGSGQLDQVQSYDRSKALRSQAQQEANRSNNEQAGAYLNSAAASEQWAELLAKEDPDRAGASARRNPSVAYHLETKLSLPSRNDQQLVEVARLELPPSYFYKTVPILSPQVYRLASFTNKSKYVLLPGEATMYLGSDFVGRMSLPLVAIGEQFIAGFGVDPQIEVSRQLTRKDHSIQGGNQVETYGYVIRVNSYKRSEVDLQVWDRLPRAENESVAVELLHALPELSTDPAYLRSERPKNLLRWDLKLKPEANGENAVSVTYDFKLQYDRNVAIGNFMPAKR